MAFGPASRRSVIRPARTIIAQTGSRLQGYLLKIKRIVAQRRRRPRNVAQTAVRGPRCLRCLYKQALLAWLGWRREALAEGFAYLNSAPGTLSRRRLLSLAIGAGGSRRGAERPPVSLVEKR